jgi:hypothetical protein
MGAIDAWSYSRWETYDKCPQLAKYKFVDKLQEPKTVALQNGIDVHKDIEQYLVGEKDEPSTPLKPKVREYYDNLRLTEVYVENQFAFDSEWRKTGWFDKGDRGAWCRVAMDAFVPAEDEEGSTLVVDHKTGGYKNGELRDPNKYDLQMNLYGVAALILVPFADKVVTELVFVDGETVIRDEFDRKRLETMKKDWNRRVQPMLNDTVFSPKPGDACRWCHFRKSNGGPCKY